MSLIFEMSILKDTASPAVATLLGTLSRPRPVIEVGANAARRKLQDYFRARPGNVQGWPSQGFWAAQARGTAVADVSDSFATIAVGDPAHPGALAHKITGGPITPKRGRFLAIPAMAAAYAAGSPREGGGPGNLAFVYAMHPKGGWRPALAVREDVFKEVGKPRKDGTRRRKLVHQVGTVWYWLVRKVVQAADQEALPPEGYLVESAQRAMLAFLGTRYGNRTQN